MPDELHISSLVVHGHPAKLPAIRAAIAAIPEAEVHAEANGKLVVTLETAHEAEIVARLHEISLLDGVLSAVLVFHQVEPVEDEEGTRHAEPA